MFSIKKNPFQGKIGVPTAWIFEHYLKLRVKLTGQSYSIRSIFNAADSKPSLHVYVNSGTREYKFKCFSSGHHGDGINLVMKLYNCDYGEALKRIREDYETYANKDLAPVEGSYLKWELSDYSIRQWTKLDVKYWSPYNIGSELLGLYNVRPLSFMTMNRGPQETFTKTGQMMYGYFTANDQLYKVYQPLSKDRKFINLLPNYLQGWDQLQGKPRLFICSSLKDIMAMRSLNIEGDYIAPQSESSNLDSMIHWIDTYAEKYTIFDNDSTGVTMMEKYKLQYGLPYLHVNLSKDISDSIRDHGAKKVKALVKSLLP